MSYSKDSYYFFKSHGICTRCQKEKALEGHTMCINCLANEVVRESKHTSPSERQKQVRKEKYQYRKQNGLCVDCGKPRYKDSASYCYEHMLYHKRKQREYNATKDKIYDGCPRCGKPSKSGYKLCEYHYNLAVNAVKEGRKKVKDSFFMQENENYWKMKQRFAVTNDNGTMKLYYNSIEQAKESWPECKIELIEQSNKHTEFVNKIAEKSVKTLFDNRNRTVCQLVFSWGWGLFRFTKQNNDWLDLCEYQLHNSNDKKETELWMLGQPEAVWNEIININPTFIELQAVCKFKGGKLTRPKELKGLKQIGSVQYRKLKCPIFVVDNDIYINHHEYFCPVWIPPDPEYRFAPLNVQAEHYFGKSKSKKFIYDDCWGSIVLQNVAWLKFQNYVPLFKYMKFNDIALMMRNQVFESHGFDTTKGAYQEWLSFAEKVCTLVGKELK